MIPITDVKGEIRVRWIEGENFVTGIKDLKYCWTCLHGVDCTGTKIYRSPIDKLIDANVVSVSTINEEDYPEMKYIQEIVDEVFVGWGESMNLYKKNCQHFSKFVYSTLKKRKSLKGKSIFSNIIKN